jgi:hypothetical protein
MAVAEPQRKCNEKLNSISKTPFNFFCNLLLI